MFNPLVVEQAIFAPANVNELTADFYLVREKRPDKHDPPAIVRVLHGMVDCFQCRSQRCDHAQAVGTIP